MTLASRIPENRKMRAIFRMEPGSLGPDGSDHVDEFCTFAQLQLQACASAHIILSIVPRHDKNLAEMEYQIASKKLPRSKAGQYLNFFGENLSDFEEQLEDGLDAIIDQYFGR